MSVRTGTLLPNALHAERRKFGRTTLFDYTSRQRLSFAFEVREIPLVVRLFGADSGQRVEVMASFGTGAAEKLQPFSPNGTPQYLDAANNHIVLNLAGKYRLQLVGEPGSCTVVYEPQLTADRDPEIIQASGVQAQNGNLLRPNKTTDIIEITDRPWVFNAYGLTGSDYIEVWATYGYGGTYREERYLLNGAPAILTSANNAIKLDVSGRYRFKLVGLLDGRLLVGNPTAYTVGTSDAGGTPGLPGPPGPQGTPGRDGQIRFTGIGPPPVVIVGAQPGDTYMDLATGDVYKLT